MIKLTHRWNFLLCVLLGVAAQSSVAQLRIDITSGVTDPIPIAVVHFGGGGFNFGQIIQQDLERSGRFRLLNNAAFPSQPQRANEVIASIWRQAGAEYVVVGRSSTTVGSSVALDFELVNVLTGQRLLIDQLVVTSTALRNGAHRISDRIYEKILGARSSFATRIAYVSVDGVPPKQSYQLILADADGENSRVILQSRFPLMSPAWSPNGEWIAYVSFESRSPAIYLQHLRTAERRRVSARSGVNGAPSWSPNAKQLALTLSSLSGNLDIYLLDLESLNLTRLTDDPGIDTEAVWSPDGGSLYFTSDRSGGPQIYHLILGANEKPKRLTFSGNYNARARVNADGTHLAMVTRGGSGYSIGIQDLRTGVMRVLSKGSQDESPAFSPDGGTLIYAGRERGQGLMATVSVDGLILQKLKADRGDVREPAWSPFIP